MKDPLVESDGEPTPLGAAVLELTYTRGYTMRHACKLLTDRFAMDCQCPACGLFSPDKVVSYYRRTGHRINPVPLPRSMLAH